MKSFKDRIQACTTRNWITAAVWCALYVAFVIWVSVGHWQSLGWLLLLPIIADMFLTHYIPWTWWKQLEGKNKVLFTIMSWVDAIGFALIAVYFINLFLFQNYQIPSSSLEKSLRVGDYLFVSKAGYGPRIPNTPLSFPLVQHTFPEWLGGGKSFISWPKWEYRRMPGWKHVEKGDIVVFNFPTGDTVVAGRENPDIYTQRFYIQQGLMPAYDEKDVIVRPVDRRENYVKRCVGTPGDTLQIIENQIYINSEILPDHEGVQYNYFVETDGSRLSASYLEKLGINIDDRHYVRAGLYHFPLTREMLDKLRHNEHVTAITPEDERYGGPVYPIGETEWTRDNYGPIYIPRKGDRILLTEENIAIYRRPIEAYEHQVARIGETYTFQMDYYWMMGDNRHNSADSRYWGFVPEDHIVGQPIFVWLSIEKDQPWGSGHIRWNRIGLRAKQ